MLERRRPRTQTAWLAAIWLVATACGDGPTAAPPAGAIDLSLPWESVEPAAVGLDGVGLERAGAEAAAIARMRSLLVVRRGRLAYERYYGGWTADTLADVRSVTKSVVSTLAGLALQRGDIADIDRPITDFLRAPEFPVKNAHGAVTVRHLLTMTGGFEWAETGTTQYSDWILSGNHVGYLLERDLVAPPGSTFTYNSGAVHLLGVVIERATGRPLDRFADEVLFGPLGITERRWESLGGGAVNGGAGIDLRPRDLARFGQLFLQQGWSGDRSVVPEAWIEEATARRFADLGSAGPIGRLSYGFLWWVDLDNDAYFAWGFGGQFVYVLPRLDLVVVATTDWRRVSQDIGNVALQEAVLDVIVRRVVPAAR